MRTGKVGEGARELLAPRAVERELLSRVDGTLRALDGRVTLRLAALEERPAKPAARAKRTAAAARPKRRKAPAASKTSGTALVAGGRKHAS